jgi:hypothetical protein
MKVAVFASGLPGDQAHPPLTGAVTDLYTGAAVLRGSEPLRRTRRSRGGWRLSSAWCDRADGWHRAGLAGDQSRHAALANRDGAPGAMLSATVLFLLAATFGHAGDVERAVMMTGLVLTLAGFGLLILGGTAVFVHGMRVLNLADEPSRLAAAPIATAAKRRAAGDDKEEHGGLTRY